MTLIVEEEAPPGPANETLARLDPLVGVWATRGLVRAEGEAPPVAFEATDTYEWMSGGFFLLHHVEAIVGGRELRVLEIFGYDAKRGGFWSRAYDNMGSVDEFAVRIEDRVWELTAQAERFRGEISEDGALIAGRWERREGEAWSPWMDVTLTKVI